MSEALEYTIKRFSRSRTLKLSVRSDGEVVVSAPSYISLVHIQEFVEENRLWIEEKKQLNQNKQELLTQNYQFLLFRGKQYHFRLQISQAQKTVINDEKLIVFAPSEDHRLVRDILTKWYRQQATGYFRHRVPLLADLLDLDVKRVSIRSQSTRWGSCSSRQTISLNWRLIMAGDWISDYVIFHELTHLIHMNHSAKFWATVEKFCPSYRQAERWLKENHKLLMF